VKQIGNMSQVKLAAYIQDRLLEEGIAGVGTSDTCQQNEVYGFAQVKSLVVYWEMP
jgi:hypothetical protein